LARVEEVFEVRSPKYKAPFLTATGKVQSIEGGVDEGFNLKIVCTVQKEVLPISSTETLLVENNDKITTENSLMIRESGEIVRSGISGIISTAKNQLIVTQDQPELIEFETIPGYYIKIKEGETISRGQALTDGSFDLQEVMDKLGFDALQDYIIAQLIGIYSDNGILVNEKHIEIIIRQMCSRVQIVDSGDSDYIIGDLVRHSVILSINKDLKLNGKNPASFTRSVTGISRASLITDSFLSAASFQEASKVLVEAVTSGRPDHLLGLKENVILGQLIPAGTGFRKMVIDNELVIDNDFADEVDMIEE
jgi:DNA-directed RNA polymerase subunit beta'